jgi:hypothetical protein
MAAFIPGASPPEVKTPIFEIFVSVKAKIVLKLEENTGFSRANFSIV